MESQSSSFFSRQRTHFWMLVFACLLLYCNPSQKTKTISVDLYPKSGTELWGFVNLAIVYGSLNNLPIKSISYDTGTVSIPVLKIDNPLRSEPGVDEISFCAKCITASKVNITVEFTDEANHEPIRKTYTINHMPVLKITSEELPNGQLLLDAGSSTDPEGKTLTFKWHVKNEIITGTTCRVNKDSLIKNPLLLSVSDGLAYGEELITSDAITNERIYTSEKLACTKMEIITTGNSLLNGEVPLGPSLPVGTQLDIDNNKRTTRPYSLCFAFEVRADITPANTLLDEGQDVARTSNLVANNNGNRDIKRGQRRKEPNRSEYEDGTQFAPYPDPFPPPGQHPPMVEDGYDHHPTVGTGYKNVANGVQAFDVKVKGLFSTGNSTQMIWFDQPGWWVLPAHTNVSRGLYYRLYFRSWMKELLTECEKFFIVEIEVDNTGKITKNQLTMR